MKFENTLNYINWRIQDGILVYYDNITSHAADSIFYHYSNRKGTAFLLVPSYGFDFNISRPIKREDVIGLGKEHGLDITNIIFVNFDHLIFSNYVKILNAWLNELNPDEIWEWQVELYYNTPFDLKDRVKFMPQRYVPGYKKVDFKEIQFDFAFEGNITQRRYELISTVSSHYIPFKMVLGYSKDEILNEFSNCKTILNIHGFGGANREQLRISEFLCMDIPVVTERDPMPYYPGITLEYDYEDIVQNPWKLINEIREWNPGNVLQKYKDLTYFEGDFNNYRKMIMDYHESIKRRNA